MVSCQRMGWKNAKGFHSGAPGASWGRCNAPRSGPLAAPARKAPPHNPRAARALMSLRNRRVGAGVRRRRFVIPKQQPRVAAARQG